MKAVDSQDQSEFASIQAGRVRQILSGWQATEVFGTVHPDRLACVGSRDERLVLHVAINDCVKARQDFESEIDPGGYWEEFGMGRAWRRRELRGNRWLEVVEEGQ